MITAQIIELIESGQLDDIEPTERLAKKIDKHKRVTSQLFKDHGMVMSDRTHFRNFASYTLKQGSLSEQDGS